MARSKGLERQLLGSFGEDVAREYLKKKGYKILGMNFSCRLGEIDIIARKGRYIVFVEVKLRKDASHGQAMEFVTAAKQHRLILATEFYLQRNPTRLQPRFDVIEVYAPEGYHTVNPEIHHIEDAVGL